MGEERKRPVAGSGALHRLRPAIGIVARRVDNCLPARKGMATDLLPILLDTALHAAFALLVGVAKTLELEDAESFLTSIADAAIT